MNGEQFMQISDEFAVSCVNKTITIRWYNGKALSNGLIIGLLEPEDTLKDCMRDMGFSIKKHEQVQEVYFHNSDIESVTIDD